MLNMFVMIASPPGDPKNAVIEKQFISHNIFYSLKL